MYDHSVPYCVYGMDGNHVCREARILLARLRLEFRLKGTTMRAEFKQKKESILAKIRENPETILLYRKPMVDDGFGGEIEDPFGTDTEAVLVVRIFHSQSTVPSTEANAAGFGSNLHRSILSTEIIYEGEVFEAVGKRFRIGKVDQIKAFGGIVGYQADLYEAAEAVSGGYT